MNVNDAVTVCIKAFERPDCLKHAVESVRDFFPDVRIIVADDSEKPPMMGGVDNFVLPFYTGLSFGRNRMVERVRTKYMFLMEDDAYFNEETKLEAVLDVMEQTDFDILGITVVDMPDGHQHPNGYMIYLRGDYGYSDSGSYGEEAGCSLCDFVENIFMARTAALQAFEGWDEDLKIHEHGDFFLRAKSKLKVAAMIGPRIMHEHLEDARYASFRRGGRSRQFAEMNFKKQGVIGWRSTVMKQPNWVKQG